MKIKKGDIVLVTKGKYRGKKGKVLKAIPKENRLIVEGVNIVKKHARPKKSGEKGKILEIPSPIFASNTKLICQKCKKPTKIGYLLKPDSKGKKKTKKTRICKKCGKET